jgi:hypothetical protein
LVEWVFPIKTFEKCGTQREATHNRRCILYSGNLINRL